MRGPGRSTIPITLAGLAIIVALAGVSAFSHYIYNRIIDREHFVDVAKGRLEAELQRRLIVITTNMEAADSYLVMEQGVYDRLIRLNGIIEAGGYQAGQEASFRNEILDVIAKIRLLVEAYPELKVKRPYVTAMQAIQESGWKVSRSRDLYNEKAYEYNVFCSLFPVNLFAWFFGFEKEEFFEANKAAHTAPRIDRIFDREISYLRRLQP